MVNGLKNICKGDEKIHIKLLRSKKETAETAATVRRRVAFRTTQTPYANMVAELLGVSISKCYDLMNEKDFPALRMGSRVVVPKDKFRQWVEQRSGGGVNG